MYKRQFPASPAERCGLLEGDTILTIRGEEVTKPGDVAAAVATLPPGAQMEMEILRGGRRLKKVAALADTTILEDGPDASRYLFGETSLRNANFPEIIQHDTALDPSMMGGPVVDLDGRLVGLNIARVNRYTSYTLPTHVFADEVLDTIEQDRARARAVGASLPFPGGPLGSARTQP